MDENEEEEKDDENRNKCTIEKKEREYIYIYVKDKFWLDVEEMFRKGKTTDVLFQPHNHI